LGQECCRAAGQRFDIVCDNLATDGATDVELHGWSFNPGEPSAEIWTDQRALICGQAMSPPTTTI